VDDRREFGLEITEDADEIIVTLVGELDMYTSRRLEAGFDEVCGRKPSAVVILDLHEVDFVDSTGLGAIVNGLKRLRARGGDLALRALSPQAMKVLELTGLTKVFEIREPRGPV
jgi:anti-anti-sigma factor